MVFFHGGAFAAGSAANFGPEYLMDYPVVIVTVQYRLNVFGMTSERKMDSISRFLLVCRKRIVFQDF